MHIFYNQKFVKFAKIQLVLIEDISVSKLILKYNCIDFPCNKANLFRSIAYLSCQSCRKTWPQTLKCEAYEKTCLCDDSKSRLFGYERQLGA